tara:strand:+ start:31 stop:612 length:582 start_codon:yes stop_codon:yes gene_type:complete
MKIDQSAIDSIWSDLINQPTIQTKDLNINSIATSSGLYLIYCSAIYSHKYLKFGKSEHLRTRISDHISGNDNKSVYNNKLSRDQKLMIATWDLLTKKDRKRFTEEYCSFQYLELDSSIVSVSKEIFESDTKCDEWYNYWQKIYPSIHRARKKPFAEKTIDHKTKLIEFPIEEEIKDQIRYQGKQPDLDNYPLQ